MNDPHIEKVFYRMLVDESVDYSNVQTPNVETDEFRVSVDDDMIVFEMKEHFVSESDACAVAEDFLNRWSILIGIEHDPDEIQFRFKRAEIIDRNPSPEDKNVVTATAAAHVEVSAAISIKVLRGDYPSLPIRFQTSPNVETMYLRFKAYRQNRESLTSMAYMCLTILEASAGGRKDAAATYRIDVDVLKKLGELSSTKGANTEARKAPKTGVFLPLTSEERKWIEDAIKLLIRRVGEYEHDSNASLTLLTMADLPQI